MPVSAFRRLAPAALAMASFSAHAETAFLIEIADTGAYRLAFEQLAELAPALTDTPSNHLALSVRGEPRRLHVHDGGDGRFGPGDSVSFYGERLFGKQSWFDTYAVNNVYRLEIADAPVAQPDASKLAKMPLTPAEGGLRRHLHLEEENLQIRLSNRWVQPDEEPDLWHWAKLTQIDPEPFNVPFALPDIAAQGTVRIVVGLRGLSDVRVAKDVEKPVDHVVDVRLNDEPARITRFESRNEHSLTFELPAARLRETGNALQLRIPKRTLPGQKDALVDVVMFNYIDIDYPIAGELDATPLPISVAARNTSANDPVIIELKDGDAGTLALYGRDGSRHEGAKHDGGVWQFRIDAAGDYQPVADNGYSRPAKLRLAPPPRWHEVDQGYDYLLIAHPTLLPEARPLAEHHRNNGLRVAEINVDDLYDEFNHGVVHPKAIRNFIAHAYHEWPAPRPRFVLLVGDASFDIRSDRAEDRRYAKWADRELLFPGQFGVIPGGHYENTDKIAAKRNLIPTWQYPSEEGHSAADNYFVAVDGDDWMPDLALGRFPVVEPAEVAAIVEKTLRYANNTDFGDWRRRTLFTTDTSTYFQQESTRLAEELEAEGFESSQVYASKEDTDNEKQINSLNQALNEGQLLVHFIGHGGRYIWRTGPPDLTRNHDLFTLDHVANLQNGNRLPMVLSMTCYSAPFDHPSADSIGERFLREADKGAIAVFAASWRNTPIPKFSKAAVTELMTPGATIGEALMRAKRILTDKWQRTLVETYNLLGDPAVVLQRPSLPLQLETRNYGDESLLDVLSPDTEINGRAQVEWRDETGTILARRWREVRGNRSTFAVPPEARDAHEVQVHLVDYRTRRDGMARLALNIDEKSHTEQSSTASIPADAAPPLAAHLPEPPIAARRPDIPVRDRISQGSMEPKSP